MQVSWERLAILLPAMLGGIPQEKQNKCPFWVAIPAIATERSLRK
jgi:hypothetical protein